MASICSRLGIPRSTFYSWTTFYAQTVTPNGRIVSAKKLYVLRKNAAKQENIIAVLKTASCNINSPLQDKLKALETLHGQHSVHVLCEALDVPRGTYYNHIFRNKKEHKSSIIRRGKLSSLIREIFENNRQIFGAEKIRSLLREQGYSDIKKLILELMHNMGLQSVSPSSKKHYLKHLRSERRQNILNQEFNVTTPNTIWASDITSFKVKQKWLNLCVVIDLFSRKVISYKISPNSSTQLVTAVVKQEITDRKPVTEKLLFHSDQGCQYTSFAFRILLNNYKIIQSLSNPGRPYNNSVVESFFSNLKREEIYRTNHRSESEFYRTVSEYIEFYNGKRPIKRSHFGHRINLRTIIGECEKLDKGVQKLSLFDFSNIILRFLQNQNWTS